MKKLIIIGANEFQNKLVKKAKKMSIETHTFAWDDGAVAKNNSDYFYPISITEKEEILEISKKIQPQGITSIASDLAMPTVNYVAEKLNLVGNTSAATIVTTNKFEMRKNLINNNIKNPNFYFINKISDLPNNLNYPLIVKPIDRSGSRGVNKIDNFEELTESVTSVKSVSFSDAFLVEEYIEGREFSVEYITEKGHHHFLQLTEKFTTGAPHFIEKGHLQPGRVTEPELRKIKTIIEKSLTSLGIENGASHSEIKITPDNQIFIIEIAGRMGRDYIGSDLVTLSTGYDYVKNVINISLGEQIDEVINLKDKISMVIFVFDEKDKFKLMKILNDYNTNIIDYHIELNFNKVIDSSTRNGYCIMTFDTFNDADNVIYRMGLEDQND